MLYFVIKYVHVIGASVLLGTGAGIAFFMLLARLRQDATVISGVARIVVIADFLFTATAVVVQPITGVWLAHLANYPLSEGWISWSIALYVLTGIFWLPVVWMQIRMRDLAMIAARDGGQLPRQCQVLFWAWFGFGFPAFAAVLIIFWLMIARPAVPTPW
jgi:uncharacterized membrane protein